MKILYDEKICVRCLACVSESECGGVTYDGQLHFDETRVEDWDNIAAICPVAAIKTEQEISNRQLDHRQVFKAAICAAKADGSRREPG